MSVDKAAAKATIKPAEPAPGDLSTDWLAALLADHPTPASSADAADFTAVVMHRVRLHDQRRAPLDAHQALKQLQQHRARELRRTRWGHGGTAAGVALALGALFVIGGVDPVGAVALPGWAALPLVSLLVTAVLHYSLGDDSRA